MKIEIKNIQDTVKINKKKIIRCARFVLKKLGQHDGELSILFVDDTYIKRLNWKCRKVNSKTDVLAFPMMGPSFCPLPKGERDRVRGILGDVVISTQTAKREADNRKIPIEEEINLYLVHGILHLLGYEDKKANDRKKMRKREKEIFSALSCKL